MAILSGLPDTRAFLQLRPAASTSSLCLTTLRCCSSGPASVQWASGCQCPLKAGYLLLVVVRPGERKADPSRPAVWPCSRCFHYHRLVRPTTIRNYSGDLPHNNLFVPGSCWIAVHETRLPVRSRHTGGHDKSVCLHHAGPLSPKLQWPFQSGGHMTQHILIIANAPMAARVLFNALRLGIAPKEGGEGRPQPLP